MASKVRVESALAEKMINEMRIVSQKARTFYRAATMNDLVKEMDSNNNPQRSQLRDDQEADGGTVYNRISTLKPGSIKELTVRSALRK